MSKFFHLKKDFEGVGDFSGISGHIPLKNILPVHSFAEDMSYTILTNGVLFCIFKISSGFKRANFLRLIDGLPFNSALQLYSLKNGLSSNITSYLCLSIKIDYVPNISSFGSVFSSLSNKKSIEEFNSYKESLFHSYEKIQSLINTCLESGYFEPLNSILPVVNTFCPVELSSTGYILKSRVAFNVSYLILGHLKKYALIVEIHSMRSVSEELFLPPQTDCETISYSCVHFPNNMESDTLSSKSLNYLRFQGNFTGSKPSSSFMTVDVSQTQAIRSTASNAVMNHYFMFLSPSVSLLKKEAENYMERLNSIGASVNASILKSEENYCYFFPGNYRVKVNKGVHQGTVVTRQNAINLLQRLHS